MASLEERKNTIKSRFDAFTSQAQTARDISLQLQGQLYLIEELIAERDTQDSEEEDPTPREPIPMRSKKTPIGS